MKITLPGFIHARPSYDGKSIEYSFWRWDSMDGEKMVSPFTIECEIGDAPDPLALAVSELERQKEAAGKEFSEKVASINEKLARLTAISYEEPLL